LFPEGDKTLLVMTGKKNAIMPGPFYIVMLAMDIIQTPISRLFVARLLRVFPRLRSNAQLSRIKSLVEGL